MTLYTLRYFENHGALIAFVQEARGLEEHPAIVERYHPLLTGKDSYTGILIRRGAFDEIENISEAVREALEDRVSEATAEDAKAWMTTANRVAAVTCTNAGVRICAASLHCSKSDGTARFVEVLKEILEQVTGADMFVMGVDTNVTAAGMSAFQKHLRTIGMDFGYEPDAEQVTVAKMRTMFQTQVLKSGETDVSHKDYLLTWNAERRPTTYTPDLRTPYGVDHSGQTVRLPTPRWPFDHAAVVSTVSMAGSLTGGRVQAW